MNDLFAPPPPAMARPRSARRLRVAGLAALAAALALYLGLSRVAGDHGWQLRRWDNPGFEGAPTVERTVVEPFEKDEPSGPFSAEWRTWLRIEQAGRYDLAIEADDQVQLFVDGNAALSWQAPSARTLRSSPMELSAGVHAVQVRLSDYGGGKYLRVFLHRLDGAHGWGPLPFPRRIAWPTEQGALRGSPGLGDEARAAGFSLVLVLAFAGAVLLAGSAGRGLTGASHLHKPCSARERSGRALAAADLALLSAVFAVALGARAVHLAAVDLHWDEGSYLHGGMHFVRNLQLGDFAAKSFRWNFEHPPVAKWLYGFAALAGGPVGGKLFAAFLQALTCVLVYGLGRRYVSRAVGAGAGFTLALLPYFLAHGRIVGLESPLTFFFTLSALLLMLACEEGSWRLHFAWGFTAVLGVCSRATGVWFAPIAAAVVIASSRRDLRRWGASLAAIPGALTAVGLVILGWPWIWSSAGAHLKETFAHWSRFHPSEWVFGVYGIPPAWYYAFAFLVVTPTLVLVLGLAGAVGAAWRRRLVDLLVLCWVVLPFGQSFASMRQDGARYVIQAFPALALLAAMGLENLALLLRRPRLTGWAVAPAAAYLAASCALVHPYELDYSSEWTGGPAAVARRKWLEIPFWGEGQRELAQRVNAVAPPRATVRLVLIPRDDFPGLRPDLVESNASDADYVVTNQFQYAPDPAGYSLVSAVTARGARLGAVFQRTFDRVAPAPGGVVPRPASDKRSAK